MVTGTVIYIRSIYEVYIRVALECELRCVTAAIFRDTLIGGGTAAAAAAPADMPLPYFAPLALCSTRVNTAVEELARLLIAYTYGT